MDNTLKQAAAEVAARNGLITRNRQIASRLPGLTRGTGCDALDAALAAEHRTLIVEVVDLTRMAERTALHMLVDTQWTTDRHDVRDLAQATAAALVAEFCLGCPNVDGVEYDA